MGIIGNRVKKYLIITCPKCHHYIVKRFDEKAKEYILIGLLDKKVNEEFADGKNDVPDWRTLL